MIAVTDRLSSQPQRVVGAESPKVLASAVLTVAPKNRKGCPMQCVGECGGGPCGNDCFCVRFDPQK